jgi:hypothetical protein
MALPVVLQNLFELSALADLIDSSKHHRRCEVAFARYGALKVLPRNDHAPSGESVIGSNALVPSQCEGVTHSIGHAIGGHFQ